MGKYKNLKIDLEETKLDVIDVLLTVLLAIAAVASIYFVNQNDELLKQLDVAMGNYNEVNYQYELLKKSYDDLKDDYEYAIDIIRTSDKYDFSEEEK